MRRTTRVLTAFFAMVLLVGCSSGGSGDSAQQAGDPVPLAQDAETGAEGDTGSGVADNREVITTARGTIVVDDPAQSVEDIAQLAEEAGGRVDQRSVRNADRTSESRPSATMTVRIPAEELTGVLDELADFGELTEMSQESDDVTQAAQDLDARIEALEASTDRLREIMTDADNSADLIEAERALSERQADLESLQSEREHLSDQVAMSTLHLQLRASADPSIEAGGFLGGLQSGWHSLVAFASGLLVAAGAALPWLVVLAIPGVPLVLALRRRRRRRKAAAAQAGQLDEAEHAPAPPSGS